MSSQTLKNILSNKFYLAIITTLVIALFSWMLTSSIKKAFYLSSNTQETAGTITKTDKTPKGFNIYYQYSVDNNNYENYQSFVVIHPLFYEGEKTIIKYNKTDPDISIIKSSEWRLYLDIIIIFSCAILVLKAIFKLAKKTQKLHA